MRILHLVESMASGTMEVVAELSALQARDGHSVHVAYSIRSDTPSEASLSARFSDNVGRSVIAMARDISPIDDIAACFKLARFMRQYRPDILHLHSSKAGAIGRVTCSLFARRISVFYSPHGFSFLRSDVSNLKRRMFALFEAMLSRLSGTVVACSRSEAIVAQRALKLARVVVVENAVDTARLPVATRKDDGRLIVVSSGRLCYQKAPWRFFALARALETEGVDFIWIGGGDFEVPADIEMEIPSNVRITGWLPREGVLQVLAESHIYVLLSLWEGMPLVLIEAQAMGLPAVVSNAVGSRDVVLDGRTGFICDDEATWLEKVRYLLRDRNARYDLAGFALEHARARFDVSRMHIEFMALYVGSVQKADAVR